jgi:hypothetical protein
LGSFAAQWHIAQKGRIREQAGENVAVFAIVLVFGIREESGLAVQDAPNFSMENLVHTDDLLRLWDRQKLQRNTVQDGENARVHSDSQRNRQDRDDGEAGILV